jgi:hypothetical protein
VEPFDSCPGAPTDFPQRYDWLVYDEQGMVMAIQGHYLGFTTEDHVRYLWWRWYQSHWAEEE